MKNFLLSLALITGFAACNNFPKQDDSRDIQLLTDSTSYHNNFYSDTSSSTAKSELTPAAEAKPEARVITITKRVIYTPAKTVSIAPVSQPQANVPPVATTVPSPEPATTTTNDNTVQTGNGSSNGNVPGEVPSTETAKKKGWSTAAKGAVIGAGAGAIGGAIIAKKKGLGAIVGGVVGAAGGYIIGKDIDKRKAGN